MPMNWKNAESQERLVACIVASFQPAKADYNKIAKLFGQGATYDIIKNQFRLIRKSIDQLEQETEETGNSPASANNDKPAKKSTAGKKKGSVGENGVVKGRVKKSTPKSAAPKKGTKAAKLEKHIAEELKNEQEDDVHGAENMDEYEYGELDAAEYGVSMEELYDEEP